MNDMIETYSDAEKAFARLAFTMPGYTMELRTPGLGEYHETYGGALMPFLRVTVKTRDTYRPDDPHLFTVQHMRRLFIPTPFPLDEFVRLIFHEIRSVLDHETKEWFRVDGIMVYDPHKNDRKGDRQF